MLMTCLFASPLVAETIGNVEYQLPEGWKIANEINTEKNKSKTIIYVPENSTKENAIISYVPGNSTKEKAVDTFGAHVNNLPNEGLDQDALAKILFPGKQVTMNVLEKDSQSILFEWSVGEGDKALHGLIRGFSNEQGTVMLFYQNEQADHFATNRDIWLKALKEAKQIQ